MRHRHGQSKLNRTSSHRKAMLANMSNSLILHERITTTLPKAKALRRVVEPLITLGKRPTVANRRLAFARLRDRDSVVKIFDELGPRYMSRPGGYTRILKDGFRKGDNAPMAIIELMDRPEEEAAEVGAPLAQPSPAPATPALPDSALRADGPGQDGPSGIQYAIPGQLASGVAGSVLRPDEPAPAGAAGSAPEEAPEVQPPAEGAAPAGEHPPAQPEDALPEQGEAPGPAQDAQTPAEGQGATEPASDEPAKPGNQPGDRQ